MNVPLWMCLPFLAMLLAIALCPLFLARFWEKNANKLAVAVAFSIPVAAYFLARQGLPRIFDTLVFDYVPFIILLGSLFSISGGIHLGGDMEATPLRNTVFLAIGAVLASFAGTTGAAMLLIRPVLKTIKERHYKVHTVLFFIGIIANTGGLLTPLGDPPLFMMYLRGAPFSWFFKLTPPWLFVNGMLLLVYFFVDGYFYKKEPAENIARDKATVSPLKLAGAGNFLCLVGVILAVAFLNEQYLPFIKTGPYYRFVREAAILIIAILSYALTKKRIRYDNRFTWTPIVEVAVLFLGIFITMVPCLLYLEFNARHLGIVSPQHFYYATGSLSSFLDNTPTAVAFHSLALGLAQRAPAMVAGVPEALLKAICCGAVFFGSMTYIGNGPNFMIRSIAEHHRIKMPHFFGYMVKFSLIVLLPVFILAQLLFVR